MKFQVEYTKRAIRDLKSLSADSAKWIIEETIGLENAPFPHKKKIRRIQGIKFPCYRLRVDRGSDSFRIFYGIDHDIVFILRIVSKKDADKIVKGLKDIDFPPDNAS